MYLRNLRFIVLLALGGFISLHSNPNHTAIKVSPDTCDLIEQLDVLRENPELKAKLHQIFDDKGTFEQIIEKSPDAQDKLSWYQKLNPNTQFALKKAAEAFALTILDQGVGSAIIANDAVHAQLVFVTILTAEKVGHYVAQIFSKFKFKNIPLLNKIPGLTRCATFVAVYLTLYFINAYMVPETLPGYSACVAYQFYVSFVISVGHQLARHLLHNRHHHQEAH